MPRGAISSEGSSGENVQHFSTLRLRAVGSGNLLMVVHSMDYVLHKELVPFVLHVKERIQPNRIVNFTGQRVSFELQLTELNEYVKINRIVVYMKEIYTSYPGA